MNAHQGYYGDDRDLLESIYPTCTTFVRMAVPDASKVSVDVAFDPTNEDQKKLFNRLCYSYEDSYDWDAVPLIFVRSERGEITWRKSGVIVRSSTLVDGVAHFDDYTNTIISA